MSENLQFVKNVLRERGAGNGIFKAIIFGSSAGGLNVLLQVLPELAPDFPLPITVVSHLINSDDGRLSSLLNERCKLPVVEVFDKALIESGKIFVAPAGFHLLIERNYSFALSVEDRVNYARPSLDVAFESAALAYGPALLACLLSGANFDGSKGLKTVKEYGGLTIAQDPNSAEYVAMPLSAVESGAADLILEPLGILSLLCKLKSLDQFGSASFHFQETGEFL